MPRWVKRVKWWFEFFLLYKLFLLSRLLPFRVRLAWGRMLGSLVWYVLRLRRGVVLDNLRAAFGSQLNEAQIHALGRDFYRNLGLTLMEFFSFHAYDLDAVRRLTTVEGLEHIEACLASGRGALLLSGHFGNWELLGASVAARGYPVRFMAKSQSNPYVDRAHDRIRSRIGIQVIRPNAAARQLVYSLRKGEFVGLLGDQDAGPQGEFVEFLGRTASVFRGPAYFAYRTGCPIILAAIFRQPDGTHRVILTPPLEARPEWDEATAVRELTLAHTRRLDGFIRQAPEHYFWVHRRWKTRSPAEGGPDDTPQAEPG